MAGRCYACDRKLGKNPNIADTRDAQTVYVGSECFKLIVKAGEAGWQPPKGGPRLWVIPKGLTGDQIDSLHQIARKS